MLAQKEHPAFNSMLWSEEPAYLAKICVTLFKDLLTRANLTSMKERISPQISAIKTPTSSSLSKFDERSFPASRQSDNRRMLLKPDRCARCRASIMANNSACSRGKQTSTKRDRPNLTLRSLSWAKAPKPVRGRLGWQAESVYAKTGQKYHGMVVSLIELIKLGLS